MFRPKFFPMVLRRVELAFITGDLSCKCYCVQVIVVYLTREQFYPGANRRDAVCQSRSQASKVFLMLNRFSFLFSFECYLEFLL